MRITKITIRTTEIVSRRIDGAVHDVEIKKTDTVELIQTLTKKFGCLLLNGEVDTEIKEK